MLIAAYVVRVERIPDKRVIIPRILVNFSFSKRSFAAFETLIFQGLIRKLVLFQKMQTSTSYLRSIRAHVTCHIVSIAHLHLTTLYITRLRGNDPRSPPRRLGATSVHGQSPYRL